MVKKAVFYHAGCPVCISAEKELSAALDPQKVAVESVHLGESRAHLAQAEAAGVKSVPAMVIEGKVFHINFGASLEDLKK